MVKRNYEVQVGRVGLINYGKDAGKYCTVLDIVDSNKVLVEGPTSGVIRQVLPLKQMAITKVTVPVARSCKTGALTRALGANKTADKVAALSWSKKLASQKKRQALSDFQRFQVMVLRKKRSTILKKAVKAELKAKGKK